MVKFVVFWRRPRGVASQLKPLIAANSKAWTTCIISQSGFATLLITLLFNTIARSERQDGNVHFGVLVKKLAGDVVERRSRNEMKFEFFAGHLGHLERETPWEKVLAAPGGSWSDDQDNLLGLMVSRKCYLSRNSDASDIFSLAMHQGAV